MNWWPWNWKSKPRVRAPGELREFVYLDEVSVLSLLASRQGAVTQGQTDSSSRASKVQASAKGKKSLLVAEGELTAALSYDFSRATSIQRKTIIQSSFKELMDLESSRLVLGRAEAKGESVSVSKRASVEKRGVLASCIQRGGLVELDVELDVEAVYRVNAVVSSMLGIVDGSPSLFDEETKSNLEQGRAAESVLSGLLGGLVPIRATLPDCRVFDLEGTWFLLNRNVVLERDWEMGRPLVAVGVAEESLFWKDLRRVLYSGSRYKVLARAAKSGLQDTWTAIKLSHVLDVIAPKLGDEIRETSEMLIKGATKTEPGELPTVDAMLVALVSALREREDLLLVDDAGERAERLIAEHLEERYSLRAFREASKGLVSALLPPDHPLRPDDLVKLRERAMDLAGGGESREGLKAVERSPLYLDCEFVAIYW